LFTKILCQPLLERLRDKVVLGLNSHVVSIGSESVYRLYILDHPPTSPAAVGMSLGKFMNITSENRHKKQTSKFLAKKERNNLVE
jgi:hypothetical protein